MLTNLDGFGVQPSWRGDGERIGYISLMFEDKGVPPSFGREQISTVETNQRNQLQLINNEFRNVDPTWSPDGTKLVFSSRRLEDSNEWWQLYIVDADGSNERQITTDPVHSVRPTWAP